MTVRIWDILPDLEVRPDEECIWVWPRTFGLDGQTLVRTGERQVITPHVAGAYSKMLWEAFVELQRAREERSNVVEMKRKA